MNNSSINSKKSMKALILAGGRGKRLDSYSKEENKCLLKFGGKHLIEYSLDNAVKLNVEEITIVVGYLAERIINIFGNSYKGVPIKYVIQWEQKGLVHAIECSREALKGSDFILFLGDEFLPEINHNPLIEQLTQEEAIAICGVIKTDDVKQISKTYSILFNENSNKIFRLIEKPKNPHNDMMGTGNIVFKNEILNYIENTPINPIRNEKELPDLIQCAIDDQKKVMYHQLDGPYVNVNTPEDMIIIGNIASEERYGKK